ncbi:MAG: MBL fold metallo-hydrolase [Parvularculaceae bacterium]|nr:MBL fold metallo-hydrolase [Parvularculaceae bacterium]
MTAAFRRLAQGLAAFVLWAVSAIAPAAAGDPFALDWRELGPGVYAGIRPVSYFQPVVGTSVIVVGDDGVLVFDPGGFPLQSERIADKIAEITDKPVTSIVISHWHGDHSFGLYKLLDRYPHAQVIAHEFTAKAFQSPLMDYAKPASEEDAARQKERLAKLLATGRNASGETLSQQQKAFYQYSLDYFDLINAQIAAIKIPQPTRTFASSVTLDLGGRRVELHHFGKGNTKGDIVAYLPDARILLAGDVIVRPTPYGFGSYPEDWAGVLKRIKSLHVDMIVPGHGEVLTDAAYIDTLISTLTLVVDTVGKAVSDGLSLDETRTALDWSAIEPQFTNCDPLLAQLFEIWFKTPIVEAQYTLATGGDNEALAPDATEPNQH